MIKIRDNFDNKLIDILFLNVDPAQPPVIISSNNDDFQGHKFIKFYSIARHIGASSIESFAIWKILIGSGVYLGSVVDSIVKILKEDNISNFDTVRVRFLHGILSRIVHNHDLTEEDKIFLSSRGIAFD